MTSSKKIEGYHSRINEINDAYDCDEYIEWLMTLKRLTKHEKQYLIRCTKRRKLEIENAVEVLR